MELGIHNNTILVQKSRKKIIKKTMKEAKPEKKEPVKLHQLQKLIQDECQYIQKMNSQLTYRQSEVLTDRFPESLVLAKLRRLENTIDPHKKWNSVYLTILLWCESENNKK